MGGGSLNKVIAMDWKSQPTLIKMIICIVVLIVVSLCDLNWIGHEKYNKSSLFLNK